MAFYVIRSQLTGMVLTAENNGARPNSAVTPQVYDGQDNQLFYDSLTDGTIRIKTSNFCLDIEDGHLVVRPYQHGDPNQQWIRSEPFIRNRVDQQRVIDITGVCRNPGASVSAYQCNGGMNQQWHFEIHSYFQQPQNGGNNYTAVPLGFRNQQQGSYVSAPPGFENHQQGSYIAVSPGFNGQQTGAYPPAPPGFSNPLQGMYPAMQTYPVVVGYPAQMSYPGGVPQGPQGSYTMYPTAYGGYPTNGTGEASAATNSPYPAGPATIANPADVPAAPAASTKGPFTKVEFYLVSGMNGLVLDVAKQDKRPGTKVIMWDRKNEVFKNQLWYLDAEENIRSSLTNMALFCSEYGAPITMQPISDNPRSQWKIVGTKIVNRLGEVLDVAKENNNRGAQVIAYKFMNQRNQIWIQDYL